MYKETQLHPEENSDQKNIHHRHGVKKKSKFHVTCNPVTFSREYPVPEELLKNLRYEYLRRELWVPLELRGGKITVIVDNPDDIIKRDMIENILKTKSVEYISATLNRTRKINWLMSVSGSTANASIIELSLMNTGRVLFHGSKLWPILILPKNVCRRMGLFELLIASDNIKHMIISRKSIAAIRKIATSEGMKTLLQCGVIKVLEGETDLTEVLSVCIR
jgi:hypothetical protein